MTRRLRLIALLATTALAAGVLGVVSAPAESAGADARSTAVNRLTADADAPLSYRSDGGFYDFVGVPAGVALDNPAVSPSTGVLAAADAHLARYGAALGAQQPGTTLTELRADSTVTGDVVRYQQNVSGVPVMGGEFVVSLGPGRELDSILARTSRLSSIPDPKVSQAAATATARTRRRCSIC